MISGRSVGASQPSQLANTGRNGIEIAPRTWACGEPVHRAGIDEDRAVGQPGPHLIHAQRRQRRVDYPAAAGRRG